MAAILTHKANLLLGMFLCSMPLLSLSQNTINIALANSLSINFQVPADPGMPVSDITDNTKWINYNVVSADPSASITVEISSGAVLNGTELRVQAGPYTGGGGGSPGTPAGEIIITTLPQTLIDNIGICDTGLGINVGHQLTYTLAVTDYMAVRNDFSTVNLTYTITQ